MLGQVLEGAVGGGKMEAEGGMCGRRVRKS